MKRTMKRCFALLLCVIMMIPMANICFAEDLVCAHDYVLSEIESMPVDGCRDGFWLYRCSKCQSTKKEVIEGNGLHDFLPTKKYPSTCVELGYTMYECSKCHDREKRDFLTEYAGHVYDTPTYEHYIGETGELAADGMGNLYYREVKECKECKQTFYNDMLYEVTFGKETNGAEIALDTMYVKDGLYATHENPTLTITEDDTYSSYVFLGWVEAKNEGGKWVADPLDEPKALSEFKVDSPKHFLAKFSGNLDLFEVAFFDKDNKVISVQNVYYKQSATPPVLESPIVSTENHEIYTFDSWDTDAYKSVRKSIAIHPIYTTEKQKITIHFMKSDRVTEMEGGTLVVDYGSDISMIVLRHDLEIPETQAEKRFSSQAFKESDGTYVYNFSGKWESADGVLRPTATADAMTLFPRYEKKPISYKVSIRAIDLDGKGAPNASYEIMKNGTHYKTGKLDNAGTALIEMERGSYTIDIIGEDADRGASDSFEIRPGEDITIVSLQLVAGQYYYEGDTETCNCICHSIFSPIWIRILNLMYSLFRIKYVCCPDLFATHPNKLLYQ